MFHLMVIVHSHSQITKPYHARIIAQIRPSDNNHF
jgi:hypothetical protein